VPKKRPHPPQTRSRCEYDCYRTRLLLLPSSLQILAPWARRENSKNTTRQFEQHVTATEWRREQKSTGSRRCAPVRQRLMRLGATAHASGFIGGMRIFTAMTGCAARGARFDLRRNGKPRRHAHAERTAPGREHKARMEVEHAGGIRGRQSGS